MNNRDTLSSISALAWAVITLLAFALLVVSSSIRGYDVYDITQGIRAITEQPALLVGGHIVFAWSGATLVFMVVAFHGLQPAGSQSYLTKVGAAFGLIASALFLFYGLIGGMGYLELSYIQSVRSADYITDTYLPLTLITNRTLAAAVTISGLWFVLTNWITLQSKVLPSPLAYLGLGAGAIALLGFVLPGGGFAILSLLLSAVWGILTGLHIRRKRSFQATTG